MPNRQYTEESKAEAVRLDNMVAFYKATILSRAVASWQCDGQAAEYSTVDYGQLGMAQLGAELRTGECGGSGGQAARF